MQTRSRISFMYPEHTSIQLHYENMISLDCEGKKILEYGCGLGSYAFYLAEKKANVYGIDISDIAIKHAHDTAKKRDVSIDFRVMNAENLEFPAETFDIICGSSILHHLELSKAVKEIYRVLRKGGKAVFIEPLGHNPIINLFRWMTPKMRSTDEHPLKMEDLKFISKQFLAVQIKHYYLFSLFTFPFQNNRYCKKVARYLEGIEKNLFDRFPFIKKLSWQVIIVLCK
jgi:ubiquinone/menaquinone biosynthesis C-methylase UbiE